MMVSEYEIKKQICEIGKRTYNKGYVAANDGNMSVRISENEILCTPTGVSKGYMTPDMICKVNMKGDVLQSNGVNKPSSEIKMHLRVYAERADVKSVVHAHPPYATSYAIAGIPLVDPIMPEAVIALGCVPIAEYGTPSTDEIPDAVSKYLQNYDAVLLENHGALTYGDALMTAYFKMESLEFYAQLNFISNAIGGAQVIPTNQVDKLIDLRNKMGISGRHPGTLCADGKCGISPAATQAATKAAAPAPAASTEAVVAEVVRRVLSQMQK